MQPSIKAINALSATGTYTVGLVGSAKAVSVLGGKLDKFVPNANFSFDCGTGAEKYWFNINRKDRIVGTEKERLANGALSLAIGPQTDIVRDSATGIEWDIVLDQRPDSNVFEWELKCALGVSFHYQADLSQSDDPLERSLAEGRPANVIGSYAVYCDRRHEYRDKAGNVLANYGTGKLAHIYRPLCHDANGVEVWAELFIDPAANLLRVTVPQSFLDSATYPVTVDPNFGIENEGATNWTTAGYSFGSHDTTTGSESGTVTEFRAFTVNGGASARGVKVCMFADSTGPAAKVGTQQTITIGASETTPTWRSVAYTATIAASTKYWFCANQEHTEGRVRYDSLSTAGVYMSQTYANAFNDPWGGDTTARSYRYSMYVVFTASGGGTTYTEPIDILSSFVATTADSATFKDAVFVEASIAASSFDSLSAIESVFANAIFSAQSGDTLALAESVLVTCSLAADVADSVVSDNAEVVSVAASISTNVSDILVSREQVIASLQFSATTTDVLAATESILATLVIITTTVDTFQGTLTDRQLLEKLEADIAKLRTLIIALNG